MTNKQKLDAIIPLIEKLFSEIANPSPDHVLKDLYAGKIAELLGLRNPYREWPNQRRRKLVGRDEIRDRLEEIREYHERDTEQRGDGGGGVLP